MSEPLVTSRIPDVSVSFSGNPPSEILDAIRSEGGIEMNSKGQKIFLIRSPNSELLRSVKEAGGNATAPAVGGSCNMASLGSLGLMRRLITNFLHTHNYPAFTDRAHIKLLEGFWKLEVDEKRKRGIDDVGEGSSRKKGPVTTTDDAQADEGNMDVDEENSAMASSRDKIIYAVPPVPIETAYGDVNDLPNGDGLFIRYIDETQNRTGEKAILNTISRYFMGALGQNAADTKNTYDRIRADNGVLMGTKEGRELAHIYKCVDIGLQCQARIFPIVSEEQYIGCALLGAGFNIHAYGNSWSPVSNDDLVRRITEAGSHAVSLSNIAELAGGDDTTESYKDVMKAKSMMELRDALATATTSADERNRIVALARSLFFGNKSLNVSTVNIAECFRLIANPEEELATDFPIHYSMLFETDRVSLVWSAFGSLAPSCHFPGGPNVDLTSSKNTPKHICFRLIPLKDATIDIHKILSDKKFCSSSNNRRSGPYKDRVYTGLDATRIFSAMSTACGITQTKGHKEGKVAVEKSSSLFDDGF